VSSKNEAPEAEPKAPLVGVLGAGQLGRMLALAGHSLGLRFLFVDPAENPPAACLGEHLRLDYSSPAAIERLSACDVVTYEFENVPVPPVERLATLTKVFPPVAALAVAQDRLYEKTCFQELGIPTPPFFNVESEAELRTALAAVGFPAVLKTRRFGYDGRGQAVLRTDAEAARAYAELGAVPLLLEGYVPFERELSLIGARARDGSTRFYPLVENHHEGGILRLTLAPAPDISPDRQRAAESYMTALFDRTGYVGVLALELFQASGRLVANEIAPRVHNSGHHTIEAAHTSQFEQHLRAILGLPLGSSDLVSPSAMLNAIGHMPDAAAVLAVPDTHLHAYGKAARSGRKVGHVTVRAPDWTTLAERLSILKPMIWSPP
jgi:5-(carboxyamino)imidazole ribonucleotide synthase